MACSDLCIVINHGIARNMYAELIPSFMKMRREKVGDLWGWAVKAEAQKLIKDLFTFPV